MNYKGFRKLPKAGTGMHRMWLQELKQIEQAQDEPQWIVAQRLLSTLTIPGFSLVVCKEFITSIEEN